MSGIDNPIIFYPAVLLIVLFAILTLGFKNIFRSLLSAMIVFFLAGFFFYILGSEYNAVIQIAIYGIAVPIILGLAIMFTNPKKSNYEDKSTDLKYVIFLAAGLFILTILYLTLTSLAIIPVGFNEVEKVGTTALQSISAFGNGLYVRYVWAFELISLVLTITIVGLTLFRRINKCKK